MSAPADAALTPVPRQRRRREVTAPFLAAILSALLSFEFLLGTYLNLFVTLPSGRDLGSLPLDGVVVLALHIVVGIMLIGASLRLTYVAAKAHNSRQTGLAAIAALGMIVAFLAGASFTFGDQADTASFVMALGFFLGMFGSALILAGAHVPRPVSTPSPETASR